MRMMPPQVKVAIVVIAVVIALFLGLMFAAGGGQEPAAGAKQHQASVSCVAGAGLRVGAVPNGWDVHIASAADTSGVPAPVLAAQLEAESGWNPNAVSPVGARGLAQFMPGTWDEYGEGSVWDPVAAIKAQGTYMGVLMESVSGVAAETGQDPVMLALAAYNAGPGRITQYNGVPPFKQTQDYVAKIPKTAQEKFSGDCTPQPGQGGGSVIVQVGPGEWASPLPGGVLTSIFAMRWGTMHWGIDLAVAGGQVTAPTELSITWSGDKGDGYGTSLVGRTTDGTDIQMRFGHCKAGSATVLAGDVAAAGTKLCDMGMTGDSTGPHLHLEIYQPGAATNAYASSCSCAVNPLPILTSKGMNF